jgi:hypothetical protein
MASNLLRAQHLGADRLRRLHVRPIYPEERRQWDALVDQHRYLGLRSLFGKTLRYVAVADERWLALLGWRTAALKCAARDARIGWPRVLHYQRLHLLANNARFLILPDAHVPNLASRVLALNLHCLSGDWQRIHGHPLLLAEASVDTSGHQLAEQKVRRIEGVAEQDIALLQRIECPAQQRLLITALAFTGRRCGIEQRPVARCNRKSYKQILMLLDSLG